MIPRTLALTVTLAVTGVVGAAAHAHAATDSCCAAQSNSGCSDNTCQADVCAIDPYCCLVRWDGICASEAADMCDVCAPSCPEATEARCGDAAYLETECGQAMVDAANTNPGHLCNTYFGDQMNLANASSAQIEVLTAPVVNNLGATRTPDEQSVPAYILPPMEPPRLGSGAYWRYWPALMDFAALLWGDDGMRYRSCEEYVWEAYYDYNQFERAISDDEITFRDIFELANGPSGSLTYSGGLLQWHRNPLAIATAARYGITLKQRDGTTPQPGQLRQETVATPKNAYFALYDAAAVADGQALTPIRLAPWTAGELLGRRLGAQYLVPGWPPAFTSNPYHTMHVTAQAGEVTSVKNLAWHREAGSELSGELDERLEQLHHRQAAFTELVARANSQLRADHAAGCDPYIDEEGQAAGCDVGTPPPSDASEALIAQVEAALVQARADGCLATGTTACDWSPSLFTDAIVGQLVNERQRAYDYCAGVTEGLSWGELQSTSGQDFPEELDYLDEPADLATLDKDKEEYLEALVSKLADEFGSTTGKLRLAQSYRRQETLGNGTFGADFVFEADWGLTGLDNTDEDCAFDATAHAGFSTGVSVLGQRLPILDFDFTAPSLDQGRIALEVLGAEQLWAPEWMAAGGATRTSLVDDRWSIERNDQTLGSMTVAVLGVPVTVAAGYSGQIGVDWKVEYNRTSCEASWSADVTPYAAIEGWMTVGVDFAIVEVGVKGRLTLLDARLPAEMEISAAIPDGADQQGPEVTVETNVDLELSTLSGRISLYAETLWDEYEKTLVRFGGFSEKLDLFDASLTVPLRFLKLACGRPGVACGG